MTLPRPGGGDARSTPMQGGTGRAKPTVPYLKVEDLQSDPVHAKILAVEAKASRFNDITVKLAVGGKPFFLGLKASNPNYEMLFNGFGDDERKWIGEEIMIGLQWNEFHEKNFINIFEAPAKDSGSKKKK